MLCASHCLPSALIWHSLICRSKFPVSERPAGLDVCREHAQRKWSLLWVTLDAFPINRWQACCSKTWTAVVWRSGPAVSHKWFLSYKIINHKIYGLWIWRNLHVAWTLSLLKCVNMRKRAHSVHIVPLAANHWNPEPQERDRLPLKLSPLGFPAGFRMCV